MRRVLAWAAVLGLAGGLLAVAPPPAGSQTTPTITLSLVDSSDTSTAVTAIGEDEGQQTLQVKAAVASAPSSSVSVSVTIAAGTATATTDYAISASSASVTISSGQMEGLSSSFTVTLATDTITEEHETIRFTGTATGYTVSAVDLAINDADRTIRLTGPNARGREGSWVFESGTNLFTADLGSGNSRDSFVASTSSTYSSNLRLRVRARNETAINGNTASTDYQYNDSLASSLRSMPGRFLRIRWLTVRTGEAPLGRCLLLYHLARIL